MKRLRAYKWVLVGALVAFLSVGAVACSGADGDQAGPAGNTNVAAGPQTPAVGPDGADRAAVRQVAGERLAAARREAKQEQNEMRAERQLALLEHLRDDMTAEDQEQYEALTGTVEQQRAAVEAARQELADTLKELRALIDKYLDVSDGSTE